MPRGALLLVTSADGFRTIMSDPREWVRATPPEVPARSRSYVDDEGRSWLVFEQPFGEYDRRRGASLIFSSELAVRRVRNYPEDWFTLSIDALARLSWGV